MVLPDDGHYDGDGSCTSQLIQYFRDGDSDDGDVMAMVKTMDSHFGISSVTSPSPSITTIAIHHHHHHHHDLCQSYMHTSLLHCIQHLIPVSHALGRQSWSFAVAELHSQNHFNQVRQYQAVS